MKHLTDFETASVDAADATWTKRSQRPFAIVVGLFLVAAVALVFSNGQLAPLWWVGSGGIALVVAAVLLFIWLERRGF